ncbi:anti-sigma factor domain-containing protein [Aquibacillus halophilus]|uniref:Anti-sigma factor domain-containing protein n=1 Tax=Aquibacillus halophilus TaxID=930132 RepID=A0A6A8D5Q2_9BACI|nr:anti-sigma factor domain-containing protein [Aquibacillus halophilus]MRH41085.1 anti-sigma factor domain-containing protein [Aquibacillus halophilus]
MKSKMYKGIVVKVTSEYVTILCNDGNFKNVPRSNEMPQIGESFTYIEKQTSGFRGLRYISLVSLLFLALISYSISSFNGEDESYLFAVDINPSIEIYTDEEFNVTKIEHLNKDGQIVVDSLQVKKKQIDIALEEIITMAVDKNYLSENEQGMVALTVIPLKNDSKIDTTGIGGTVEKALQKYSVAADVIIGSGNKNLKNESEKVNLSINKYQLFKEIEGRETTFSLDQVREESIASIVSEINRLNTSAEEKENLNKKTKKSNSQAVQPKENSNDKLKEEKPQNNESKEKKKETPKNNNENQNVNKEPSDKVSDNKPKDPKGNNDKNKQGTNTKKENNKDSSKEGNGRESKDAEKNEEGLERESETDKGREEGKERKSDANEENQEGRESEPEANEKNIEDQEREPEPDEESEAGSEKESAASDESNENREMDVEEDEEREID